MSDSFVHVRLPAEVVARLDHRAAGEMRSRSNLVAWLVAKGLQESAEPTAEKKEG